MFSKISVQDTNDDLRIMGKKKNSQLLNLSPDVLNITFQFIVNEIKDISKLELVCHQFYKQVNENALQYNLFFYFGVKSLKIDKQLFLNLSGDKIKQKLKEIAGYDKKCKITILGARGVGKTALALRFVHKISSADFDPLLMGTHIF